MTNNLVTIKKNQYRGYYQRWNIIDFSEIVDIPAGKYFQNENQLIVALNLGEKKYSQSAKHGYLIKKES